MRGNIDDRRSKRGGGQAGSLRGRLASGLTSMWVIMSPEEGKVRGRGAYGGSPLCGKWRRGRRHKAASLQAMLSARGEYECTERQDEPAGDTHRMAPLVE